MVLEQDERKDVAKILAKAVSHLKAARQAVINSDRPLTDAVTEISISEALSRTAHTTLVDHIVSPAKKQ
jgi:hypothetical protein